MMRWRGVIEEFRAFLPVTEQTPVVTLCEGNTPLIQASRLAKRICPHASLYLKVEGANPTGSFKDRGMSLAVSKALEKRARAVLCASTGNTSASAAAYGGRAEAGQMAHRPKMIGVQAEGAAPIVRGHVVEQPKTIATAIRIGNPASWKLALQAVEESSGDMKMVTDKDILVAYHLLAAEEGVFCEPASAASVAGLTMCSQAGLVPEGATVVCTLTGHGLKDPDTAVSTSPKARTVKATRDDVLAALRA